MNELYYLRQIMGGSLSGGYSWISVALLVVLATVCLFKPERIRSATLFRWSCSFFALSLIMIGIEPLVMNILEMPGTMNRRGMPAPPSELRWVYSILNAAQPLCLALSVYCLFSAIAPRAGKAARSQPEEPTPHALD